MSDKFYGMLGLCRRAGKLAQGESKAADAVRGGRCYLLLLAEDAGPNTKKRFCNMTQFYQVPRLTVGERAELTKVLGRPSVVLAVTDAGFAEQLQNLA